MYPFKWEENKIMVFCDSIMDSICELDLVNVMNEIDKKYFGKLFMVLELVNDTTLEAIYPMLELIRNLNGSIMERTFFPEKFEGRRAF